MVVYNDRWILISVFTHLLQQSNTYTVQDLKAAVARLRVNKQGCRFSRCHKISKLEEGMLLSNLLGCTCESYVPYICLFCPLNTFSAKAQQSKHCHLTVFQEARL